MDRGKHGKAKYMNWDALLLLPLFIAIYIASRWIDQNHNDKTKEDKVSGFTNLDDR